MLAGVVLELSVIFGLNPLQIVFVVTVVPRLGVGFTQTVIGVIVIAVQALDAGDTL